MAKHPTYTDRDVLHIAKRQKRILWLILIYILAYAWLLREFQGPPG